jgi:hypothetical protein
MFRKTLLSLALLAVLCTTLATAPAEAAPPPGLTLSGYIVALKPTGQIILTTSSFISRPVSVLVDKVTVIRLGKTTLGFGELRVGDFVQISLRPESSQDSTGFLAQWIDVNRATAFEKARH